MAPWWSLTVRLRWCVIAALCFETLSLVFGPIKDLIIWRYPATLFKPSISYSSQLMDDVFRDQIDNISFLNPLGESVIAIEFPNLNFAAELATLLGYDYNAENLWSVDASLNNSNVQPTWMSALSQDVLGRIQVIISSPDTTVRSSFYDACSQQLTALRTGESDCWYSDHRATSDVKELLLFMVNQLNAHPAGIVFGTVKENDISGSNISASIQIPQDSKFNFSLFYGGQALGFGDAHATEGISRFFTSDLIPSVCNSIEAYLCLRDQNLDDLFFDHVPSNESLPLNKYLYRKSTSDPAYLSKLLLPEYDATLQVCRPQATLQDRLAWLMDNGSLMNVWPRVTFDYLAEVLINTLASVGQLTRAESAVMQATKYQYPGEPYVYADKRAKLNIFGDKSLQINSTKKIIFTTYKAAKTFPWRRHLLSEWYYHALNRTVLASPEEADYFVHNSKDCVYTSSEKSQIQSHRVKHYSFAASAAFTGCHPIKVAGGDCGSLPDLNNVTRWHMASYGAWDAVKMPTPIQPLVQMYTEVSSFDQFILAVRSVMSFPMISIDIDNSRARPVAETTYWRNYVLADMGGLMDGALPFLTQLTLSMGQLESDISMRKAKSLYVQRFFNPIYNALTVGRPLFARSRMMVIPFLPYPLEMAANLQIPFVNVVNDVLCAYDRFHSTSYMHVRGRDHNGMCGQVKGPWTGDRSKYDMLLAPFYNTSIKSSLYEDELAVAIASLLDKFEQVTNTNLTRTVMQSCIASTYPAFRLSPNFNHRIQAWRFYPLLFGRGESYHIPANFNQLYTNAGLKYVSQGFYMDHSMEGAYKILTFVSILTSFANALFTIATVILPALVAVSRVPDVELNKDDVRALFSMDLACASYSATILLPFNVLSGLIPVMEILTQLDRTNTKPSSSTDAARSVLVVFLCSWRFGVGVLSIAADTTLPGRVSWTLAAVVTGLFYFTIHMEVAQQMEIYSRALAVAFINFVLCAVAIYPLLRWYRAKYTQPVANTSINGVVNIDIIFISKAGLVYSSDLVAGDQAEKTEAYIASKHGSGDVTVSRRRSVAAAANKQDQVQEAVKPLAAASNEVNSYRLATPSLSHALEAAARYKTAIWVNFDLHTVRPLVLSCREKPSEVHPRSHRERDDVEARDTHKTFNPLAVV